MAPCNLVRVSLRTLGWRRRRPFVRRVALAVAAVVAGACGAQDLPRQPGFGRVLGKDGKPWVGATVFLEHRAHPLVQDAAYVDRLEATTDERGQFRVRLLPASTYAVWARSEVAEDSDDADGSFRRTGVVENAVAHTPILLQQLDLGCAREVQVRVQDGDTTWNGAEPRYVLLEDVGPFQRATELRPEGGFLRLPASPDPSLTVEVYVGGFVVATLEFSTVMEDVRGRGVEVEVLPPLRRAVFQIRDPRGRLVGGAEVSPLLPRPWSPNREEPARSDALGRVERWFASHRDSIPRHPYHRVVAPGLAEISLEPPLPRRSMSTTRTLNPGQDVAGRVLSGAQKPMADLPLVLESSVQGGPTSYIGWGTMVTRTAEDGSFMIGGRAANILFRVAAVLPITLRQTLSGPDAYPAAPVAMIRPAETPLAPSLGDVFLDDLDTLDVQVRNPDGTPPGSVLLLWNTGTGPGMAPVRPVLLHTDRRGRLRLLSAGFDNHQLVAISERGAAVHCTTQGESELELELAAPARLRVQARWADGSPAGGVSVEVTLAGGRVANALHRDRMRRFCPGARATTDSEGRATLLAPCVPGAFNLRYRFGSGSRSQSVPPATQWGDQDEPISIVVPKR